MTIVEAASRAGAIPALGYHAMRMRWCRAALLAFMRRWGVYLVVGAMAAAAGSSGAVTSVRALCAWLVLPLFRATAEPLLVVPAVLLQAMLGGALVWGMRAMLWPFRWAAAERALPIARLDTVLSDAVVVALGLSPLVLLYAVGAQTWIARDPAWLHPVLLRALIALCVAVVVSLALGAGVLQFLRRAAPGRPRGAPGRPAPANEIGAPPRLGHAAASPALVDAGWLRVLLWWPLWRGPARRSGRALFWGSVALCAPSIGLLVWESAASWWLAAYAVLALLVTTRLSGLAGSELIDLMHACEPLPLSPRRLRRGRELLALAPLPLSSLLMLACLPLAAVRPHVLAAYGLACFASCFVEVRSAPTDPAAKASRWLFCVALMLAFASEVMV